MQFNQVIVGTTDVPLLKILPLNCIFP